MSNSNESIALHDLQLLQQNLTVAPPSPHAQDGGSSPSPAADGTAPGTTSATGFLSPSATGFLSPSATGFLSPSATGFLSP